MEGGSWVTFSTVWKREVPGETYGELFRVPNVENLGSALDFGVKESVETVD